MQMCSHRKKKKLLCEAFVNGVESYAYLLSYKELSDQINMTDVILTNMKP